ncbi:phosphatidylserine/phosphatidylglycerophosphate/cardiolipin synthase [Sphaerochaeta pleomorpha str. Grapes]|uniref:Phosphatidylserine/phosphatidylglycerophosphate/ cardiolipin synthase n=1 Tax=Sphaerochaeta pleomorpha (strain ATCC BAA-1885 / DSM 22778 / Grapes) TaxID=158190 RepID=G8QVW8_SPHPG|nr:phosphatidylserine/phosphatidylglycerophosphate/cardiolipin synthase family protein [Sphaerochaeta pleomorpha]AEV30492.1 phosphatidylserine/phosphatidylglycerophosphate/cardiolipin synthase [Sphaerochaeta pleomorpha str. Grapes]
MKRSFLRVLTCFVLSFFLLGCSTTKNMVSGPSVDPALNFEQKMAAYDVPKVSVTIPVVYNDGQQWRDRVIELVNNAQDYVILASFLASSSEELEELYATITRKAEEGVRIYFIVDGTGTFDMTETRYHLIPLNFLVDSGVHLLEFSPMSAPRLVSGLNLAYRDHRKYVIIDGKTLAIGGMNLNYISVGADNANLQRDSMYEFASPSLCKVMLDAFVPWWNEQTWDTIKREDFSVDESFGADEQQYDAWFAQQYPKTGKLSGFYGSLLSEAKHSVKTLPFLPYMDNNMLKALSQTVDRGVHVSMIIPFDRREANRRGIEYMITYLLDTNIDLRHELSSEVSQQFLHEKLMIVDSRYVVIGSSNLNYRTMNLAYDISLVIDSPEFASQIEKHYQILYDQTLPITKEEAKQWHSLLHFPQFVFGFFGG